MGVTVEASGGIGATFQPLGDQAILIRLPDTTPAISSVLFAIANRLEAALPALFGVTEWSLGYDSIAVFYHPLNISPQSLIDNLKCVVHDATCTDNQQTISDAPAVAIPVLYGGDYGPDLEEVASVNHLHPNDVIRLHEGALYRVALIGFAPGFPYLEGLHPGIATPRKATPRMAVPKGSVGIAGQQTGIYSFETPGGWQIIGRTPISLFNPLAQSPSLLRPGVFVRFQSVTQGAYDAYVQRRD